MDRPIAKIFAEYIREVYEETPARDSDQYKQLRDAFYAGALVAHTEDSDEIGEELREYGEEAQKRADQT
jgi:hypothetical protein